MESILVATSYSTLHSFIYPEAFHCGKTLNRKRFVYANVLSGGYNAFIFLFRQLADDTWKDLKSNT